MTLLLKTAEDQEFKSEFPSHKLVDVIAELRRQGIAQPLDGSGNILSVTVDDPYKVLKHLKKVVAI